MFQLVSDFNNSKLRLVRNNLGKRLDPILEHFDRDIIITDFTNIDAIKRWTGKDRVFMLVIVSNIDPECIPVENLLNFTNLCIFVKNIKNTNEIIHDYNHPDSLVYVSCEINGKSPCLDELSRWLIDDRIIYRDYGK